MTFCPSALVQALAFPIVLFPESPNDWSAVVPGRSNTLTTDGYRSKETLYGLCLAASGLARLNAAGQEATVRRRQWQLLNRAMIVEGESGGAINTTNFDHLNAVMPFALA